jgi:hypothetical protein
LIYEVIQLLRDEMRESRASILALRRILKEIGPLSTPEIKSIIDKYGAYYKENMEKLLLILETSDPGRAALLDKKRPLISPSELDS